MLSDSIIVGAGPAGMTAAIQLKRMGLRVRLFERGRPGGLLLHAGCVENYPGLTECLDGERLAAGVEPEEAEILDWTAERELFAVETSSCGTCLARTLILATGTKPLKADLAVDGKAGSSGKVLRDFLRLRSMPPSTVVIVGGGDAAFDYALTLASRGWKATVVFRKERPAALGLLVQRVAEEKNISVLPAFTPERVQCGEGSLLLHGIAGEERKVIEAEYVLTAVGRAPEDKLLKGFSLPAGLGGQVEGVPGLYAAGDVRRSLSRQAVIASGDGMASAMAAAHCIRSR
jgi:thioredoxin reductase (NADPH)